MIYFCHLDDVFWTWSTLCVASQSSKVTILAILHSFNYLSFPPVQKQVSMTRKCHSHKLQTKQKTQTAIAQHNESKETDFLFTSKSNAQPEMVLISIITTT